MSRIRVPAGVRIGRQSFGGRFVSRDMLIHLAATTDADGLRAIERLAEREEAKAARAHQRAADRYLEDPKRYQARRSVAQQLQQDWGRVVDAAKDFQETTPAGKTVARPRGAASRGDTQGARGRSGKPKAGRAKPGRAGTRRAGKPTPKAQSIRPPVARADQRRAVEWEVGFKYRASERGRRSSDVDVNIRVRRVDGRPVSIVQARKVMAHIRRAQEAPDGYMVAGVDWKRPRSGTGWRSGDVSDMDNFWAPMFSRDRDVGAWNISGRDFRYGAVKGEDSDDD